MARTTFSKSSRGVSAPTSGRDTLYADHNRASYCENCGHVGHEHEPEKVFHDDGSWSYDLLCPIGGDR